MARYQLILAYDGTQFCGFQRQASKSGKQSVQGVLEQALRRIGWGGRALLAAGRTDTGVHAAGQVVAVDLDWPHSESAMQSALNAHLPPEVAVQKVTLAAAKFHPRYDAQARRYQYRIYCQPSRDPLRERYAWRVWPELCLEPMQQAATFLPGEHDFAAFGSPLKPGGSTLRTIFSAAWQPGSQGLCFDILGDAFLYRMVRRLVSFLVAIGQAKFPPDAMQEALQNPASARVMGLAPARGLTLVEVLYA